MRRLCHDVERKRTEGGSVERQTQIQLEIERESMLLLSPFSEVLLSKY